MYLATDPPDFACRERLATSPQQPKGNTNMSAKALADCSFEPAAEPTVATDHAVSEGSAVEIQFREDLWREYRLEAINAGFSLAQATEYASALSPEMGLAVGVSETAPAGRGWFYQSRIRVPERTITSGFIELTHWGKSKAIGRTRTTGASTLARAFRRWKAGG